VAIRGRAHAQTTHGFLEREPPLYVSCVPTMYKDWKSGNNPIRSPTSSTVCKWKAPCEFGYREELERINSEVPSFVTHD
jgi:hypothetical protein